MGNYLKQIKRQNFKNEFRTIIDLDVPFPDEKHSEELWNKVLYWKENDGIYIFDFLIGGDKFITGDLVDLSFFRNLVGDVLERDFEKDWNTNTVKIIERKFFYSDIEYDDNENQFEPVSCPLPTIFYKIQPYFDDSEN